MEVVVGADEYGIAVDPRLGGDLGGERGVEDRVRIGGPHACEALVRAKEREGIISGEVGHLTVGLPADHDRLSGRRRGQPQRMTGSRGARRELQQVALEILQLEFSGIPGNEMDLVDMAGHESADRATADGVVDDLVAFLEGVRTAEIDRVGGRIHGRLRIEGELVDPGVRLHERRSDTVEPEVVDGPCDRGLGALGVASDPRLEESVLDAKVRVELVGDVGDALQLQPLSIEGNGGRSEHRDRAP